MEKIEFQKLILDWSTYPMINGKSFDEFCTLDGLPLGWFFEKMFFTDIIPKPINTYNLLKNNKKLTNINKITLNIKSKILRKVFIFNEMRKFSKNKALLISNNRKKVLFLIFTNHLLGDGKFTRIQGLIDIIKQDEMLKEFILVVDPLSNLKNKHITEFPSIYNYFSEEISQKAKIISKELHEKILQIDENTRNKLFYFKGNALWPYFKPAFNFYFSQEFLYLLVLYYELFKKIILEENIKVVVLTSQNILLEKCLMAAAEKNNIFSVVIQHGQGFFKRPAKSLPSTNYAVFSELYKNRLINSGIKAENIKVVGPLVYDKISKFLDKNNVPQGKKKILITTQPLVETEMISKKDYFRYLRNIIGNIQKIENVELIIKLHPGEIYITEYNKLVKQFPNTFLQHSKDAEVLYQLIFECNLMINFYGSSTIIEASILDKPSLTIDLPHLHQNFYGENDPSTRIKYSENLNQTIINIINNPQINAFKRKNTVKTFCYTVDGKANQRIKEFIQELVDSTQYPVL